MRKEKNIKTSLTLDRDLYAEMKKLATMKGVSVSELINEALRLYIEREKERKREKFKNSTAYSMP